VKYSKRRGRRRRFNARYLYTVSLFEGHELLFWCVGRAANPLAESSLRSHLTCSCAGWTGSGRCELSSRRSMRLIEKLSQNTRMFVARNMMVLSLLPFCASGARCQGIGLLAKQQQHNLTSSQTGRTVQSYTNMHYRWCNLGTIKQRSCSSANCVSDRSRALLMSPFDRREEQDCFFPSILFAQ
jgi:hypothetical protein